MSTQIAKFNDYVDPFAAFATQEGGALEGEFLKFTRGAWMIGDNEVKEDTRLIAGMSDLHTGWLRWGNASVTDRVLGRVAEGFVPPPRSELGDNNEAQWDTGPGGPRDPWVFTAILPLIAEEDDRRLVYSTSSFGGRRAIARLSSAYARRRDRTSMPVVTLGGDSYKHKTFGLVHRPLFVVVGWLGGMPELPAPKPARLNDEVPF
jgi:hypothetical protein